MSTDPELPPAPWSRSRPRRVPSKAPLTQDAIIETALAILDAEGLDGISMRRIAERLETGPASLYQHIADKEELLEQLLDRVLGEVELPAPDPDDWQTPLKQMLRELRSVLAAHRDLAYVTLGRVPTGPNGLRGAETLLAIMRAGGVPSPIAAYAVDSLALFVGSVVYEEAIQVQRMGDTGAEAEYFEGIRRYFAALPAERFPTLVAMVDDLTRHGDHEDERFEFALDVQIRGIAALMAERER
ncbi:TetR/AcrR family transcriptional regulator [Conexibacter sp. CPCC 206217]|uniref:TetR/AcrR family transcriptional regulator n=1 Tax=Conexibacter sp. CPCC 206217 TaxID=3064574 RepID=UPI002715CB3F|nr:TetR/AcrR family transcriptional regulator [Conexibacter sp. CPCC 206217]MDO8209459.1 TetR/AcrR family transcriptional regulator [Conexibacter sp. CPCC 206217]